MAARKVSIGQCATATKRKICRACGIYEFLVGQVSARDGLCVAVDRR
jgi:hypothetical protein